MNKRYILAIILPLVAFLGLFAQESSLGYYVALNSIAAKGDYAPFWLTANRQGVSSVESANGYTRMGLAAQGTLLGNKVKYECAADVLAGYDRYDKISLQQLYARFEWRKIALSVGQKERCGETSQKRINVADSLQRNTLPLFFASPFEMLGSGGLVYSGNSRPVPQVRFEVPEYIPVYGTNGWLSARGHIAYGLFLDHNFQEDFSKGNPHTHYTKNVLYHSKAMFIKVGKPEKFPVTFEGGLEMYSQFGGDTYRHGKGKVVSMPKGFAEYLKAFIPLGGSSDTPDTEQSNISGNQVGNWNVALTLHTKPADVTFYMNHLFEDFSQLFFFEYQADRFGDRNIIYYPWRDMLLGVNVCNKSDFLPFVSNVTYEYLSTYDQSGAGYNDPGPFYTEQMDGQDNYYNHAIYAGWHNFGMGMGNPLVFSPVYNRNGNLGFAGNRLIAHHAAVNGAFGRDGAFVYRLMYTYSENWGTYYNPFNEKKYSTSVVVDAGYAPRASSWAATISVACDKSDWLGDNVGVMFSFIKTGIFK